MSHLWTHKRGERFSAIGASDIFGLTPVTPSAIGNKGVVPPASSNQELLGAVYQDTIAGRGTAIYFNSSSTLRFILSATCATAGVPIGVVGSTTATHPISGNTANLPLLGPVTGAAGGYGATGAGVAVWQIGEAEETGIPGQPIAVRINPRQLSGLA